MKKLNDTSKFFTLNIKNINSLIDTLGDDNKYNVNHKDLLTLLYIIKSIEFNTNVVTITEVAKKHIKNDIGMSDSSFNHFITKMRKLGIFSDKQKNNVYEVNKEYINYGNNEWQAGEFIKVSTVALGQQLEKSKTTFSATEIKLFLYLLNNIKYNNDNFDSNTIVFDKKVRETIQEKFGTGSRSLDTFIKKMKDSTLLIKINNSIYKVNDRFFVFGGDINTTPVVVRDTKFVKPDGAKIPTSRAWLFQKNDKKGDDINE